MKSIAPLSLALAFGFLTIGGPCSSAQDVAVEPLNVVTDAQAIYPVLRDSTLYFASNEKWDLGKTYFNQRGQYLYKIFSVKVKDRMPSGSPRPYFFKAGKGTNMFCLSFDPDGAAYVTENDMSQSLLRGAPMRISRYSDASDPKGRPIDTPSKSNSGMAAVSPDGKMLVFASDARGGEGRADLYYCTWSLSGWSAPANLGPQVNTPGNETAPYIHSSGKIFFASDGRDDSQGLDIYYTMMNSDGSFSEPQKAEDGINGMRDDYGIFLSDDETWGYITSNRDGKDALYYFHRTFPSFPDAEELQHVELCYTLYEASAENYDTTSFQCKWSFGDGESAYGVEVDHCYQKLGTYNVELSVLDKTSGEEMFSLAQYELELEKPDQVEIIVPEEVTAGQAASFSANVDGIPDFRPSNFYWEMGNGDRLKGGKVSTVFASPGVYRVKCGTIDARNQNKKRCTWVDVTVK